MSSHSGAAAEALSAAGKVRLLGAEAAASQADLRAAEDRAAVGGMRNPARAVAANPQLRAAGSKVRAALEEFLAEYPEAQRILDRVGDPHASAPPERLVAAARRRVAHALDVPESAIGTVDVDGHKGRLQPALLGGFVRAAADCEVDVESWLTHGAPMGVNRPITPRGVFPRTDRYPGRPAEEISEFLPDVDTFANYASVEAAGEESAAALAELQREVNAGFAGVMSAEEAERRFGRLLLGKLGCLQKLKDDGTLKLRIVHDLKRSCANEFQRIDERIVPPAHRHPGRHVGARRALPRQRRVGDARA